MNYYNFPAIKVVEELESNLEKGLTLNKAEELQLIHGLNEIGGSQGKSALQILLHQFLNLLTLILIAAVILSILTDHTIDAVIITILIFINVSVGFYLEYKAEKRILGLRKMIQYRCRVLRDGNVSNIETSLLVPGDIVILEDGQSVPADIRVLDAKELTTIESSLTGESLPISKITDELPEDTVLGDRKNMLFMGTSVATGECIGIVTNTGLNTELGKISVRLDSVKSEKSLFHIRTEKLMKQMIAISVGTTVAMATILTFRQAPVEDIFQVAFASLISGIPEGLPTVLTVLLSIASVKMSNKNALLRNLPSIETLSTTTTIITDKTGTLTQNVMMVEELMLDDGSLVKITGEGWSHDGDFLINEKVIDSPKENIKLYQILEFNALMSNGESQKLEDGRYEITGYPTEVARTVLANKAGLTAKGVQEEYEVLDSLPYDQDTKYKVFLIHPKNDKKGINYLVILGGAEKVLECSEGNNRLHKYVTDCAVDGYRMQAVAMTTTSNTSIDKSEIRNLNAIAALRIADPVRPEVARAIELSKKAGIRVIMATGDHVATAFAIAREIGIIPTDASSIDIAKYAVSQNELDTMSEDEFRKKVKTCDVFARVTPETKIRIAEILQGNGEIIAMTGDGVNDAPVLKKADIGIAMGLNGTDVAKESSDMVLMDDSFSTIIDAIKEGRTVFRNIRQTSLYLITTNFAEAMMLILTLLMGLPLPLIPIQILWLNLVTDGLSDVALATEGSTDEILSDAPKRKDAGIITRRDLMLILSIAILMLIIAIGFYSRYYAVDLDKARSMAFTAMVFTQLFNVFNMRSLTRPIWELGYFTNKAINISIVISLVLFFGAMYLPFISGWFRFTHLSFIEILTILVVSSSVLIMGEVYKWLRQMSTFRSMENR